MKKRLLSVLLIFAIAVCSLPCFVVQASADQSISDVVFSENEPVHRIFTTDLHEEFLNEKGEFKFEYTSGSNGYIDNLAGWYVSSYFPRDNGQVTVVDGNIGFRNNKTNTSSSATHGWYRGFSFNDPDTGLKFNVKKGFSYRITYNYDVILNSDVETNVYISSGWGYSSGHNIYSDDSHETYIAITSSKVLSSSAYGLSTEQEFVASFDNIDESGFRVSIGDFNKNINCNALIVIKSITVEENELLTFSTNLVDYMPAVSAPPSSANKYTSEFVGSLNLYRQKFVYDNETGAYGLGVTHANTGVSTFPTEANFSGKRPFGIIVPENINITGRSDIMVSSARSLLADPSIVYNITVEYEIRKAANSKSYFAIISNKSSYVSGLGYSYNTGSVTDSSTKSSGTISSLIYGELHTSTGAGSTDFDKFIGVGFASTAESDMFIVKKVTVQAAKYFVNLSQGVHSENGNGYECIADPENSLYSIGHLSSDGDGNYFTVNSKGSLFNAKPGYTYKVEMDVKSKNAGNPFGVYLGYSCFDDAMIPIDEFGHSYAKGNVTSNTWSHIEYNISLSPDAPSGRRIYFYYTLPGIYIKNVKVSNSEGILYGDVNSDGTVNVDDSVQLVSHLAGCIGFDNINIATSDVDDNGKIDLVDIAVLNRHLADWKGYATLPYYVNNARTVTLNVNGKISDMSVIDGSPLPALDDYFDNNNDDYIPFEGWYDSTFTTRYYNIVPGVDEYFAKYSFTTIYSFESETFYDPNNKYSGPVPSVGLNIWRFAKDPANPNNTTAYADMTNNAGMTHFALPFYDGINEGFKTQPGVTYSVSFKYKVVGSSAPKTEFSLRYSSKSKIGTAGGKSIIFTNQIEALNDGAWHDVTFDSFTATDEFSSYPYLILLVQHASSSESINVYVDDIVIREYNEYSPAAVFVVNGKETIKRAFVGSELPVLDDIKVSSINKYVHFLGWYNSDYTVKYTKYDAAVKKYYAKYDQTVLTFETGALFDPHNRFNSKYRFQFANDNTDPNNRCMVAYYNGPSGNDNVSLSLYDHLPVGYTLTSGKKYVIVFDYKVVSDNYKDLPRIYFQVRGSAEYGIGTSGGKTDAFTNGNSINDGNWHTESFLFTATDAVKASPYLLFFAMYSGSDKATLYLDDFYIFELDSDETVVIKKIANNVQYNINGRVQVVPQSFIGDPLMTPTSYPGIDFLGWRSAENLSVIIPNVPRSLTSLVAKYDSEINDFDGYGIFDDSGMLETDERFSIVSKAGTVAGDALKVDLSGSNGNHNTSFTVSGFDKTLPRLLKTGYTYTVTTRYYAENITNDTTVNIQFRGSNSSGIGNSGGKTNVLGGIEIKQANAGQWLTSTFTFTYNEDSNAYPYLLLLAQDEEGMSASVYFDYIGIKEIAPDKTFVDRKTDKINGYSLSYSVSGRKQYIVVPAYNFPYLAKMQIEKLEALLVNSCGSQYVYLHEDDDNLNHSLNEYMSRIAIGDVTYAPIKSKDLTEDQYSIRFNGGGKVYINGGSTYALAMGVSEFARMIESKPDGTNFQDSDSIIGSYEEAIKNYSNKDYYMPTFMDDFNGTEVNTTYWNVFEPEGSYTSTSTGWYDNEYNYSKSYRLGENTVVSDGSLKIYATYESGEKTTSDGRNIISYYGGMLRSHGKLKYRQGYAEISCRVPLGNGFWTTLWFTNPAEPMGLYTAEVDVNENYGISNAERCDANFHLWPTSAGSNQGLAHLAGTTSSDIGTVAQRADSGKSLFDDLHTYGFMWCEDYCQITFDGDVIYTYFLDTEYKKDAMSDYLSIIVSMAVGFANDGNSRPLIPHYDDKGNWVTGETLTKDTVIDGVTYKKGTYIKYSDLKHWNETNYYEVDYVHIYQIEGQEMIIAY